MNGRFMTEAYDDEAYDDEAYDDEASYYDSRRRRYVSYQPMPQVRVPPASGVDRASLATPAGSATINMPQSVLTVAEYQQATQRLEAAINRLAERNNALQSDFMDNDRRLNSTLTGTRRRERRDINRLRDEVRSQSMMNTLFNFIALQQVQRDLANHTHPIQVDPSGVPVETGPTDPNSISSSNSSTLLLLLPLLMGMNYQAESTSSSDNTGFGGNNMMWIFLLLIMSQGNLFGRR